MESFVYGPKNKTTISKVKKLWNYQENGQLLAREPQR